MVLLPALPRHCLRQTVLFLRRMSSPATNARLRLAFRQVAGEMGVCIIPSKAFRSRRAWPGRALPAGPVCVDPGLGSAPASGGICDGLAGQVGIPWLASTQSDRAETNHHAAGVAQARCQFRGRCLKGGCAHDVTSTTRHSPAAAGHSWNHFRSVRKSAGKMVASYTNISELIRRCEFGPGVGGGSDGGICPAGRCARRGAPAGRYGPR